MNSHTKTRSSHLHDDNEGPLRECPLARIGRMLERYAGMRVQLILPDWDTVDAARAHTESERSDLRVSVHHALALAAVQSAN